MSRERNLTALHSDDADKMSVLPAPANSELRTGRPRSQHKVLGCFRTQPVRTSKHRQQSGFCVRFRAPQKALSQNIYPKDSDGSACPSHWFLADSARAIMETGRFVSSPQASR